MHTLSEPKKIELALSRYDCALFGVVHLSSWMLLVASIASEPAWLLLLPWSIWLAWRHYLYICNGLLWLIPPNTTYPDWQLCSRQGEWHLARLSTAFVHPWLTVLDFSLNQNTYRLLIWPDSIKSEQSRQLRRICVIVTDNNYPSTMKGYRHNGNF